MFSNVNGGADVFTLEEGFGHRMQDVEEGADRFFTKYASHLPAVSRLFLVASFLEDGVSSQWLLPSVL
jgi:hypothetical protein